MAGRGGGGGIVLIWQHDERVDLQPVVARNKAPARPMKRSMTLILIMGFRFGLFGEFRTEV